MSSIAIADRFPRIYSWWMLFENAMSIVPMLKDMRDENMICCIVDNLFNSNCVFFIFGTYTQNDDEIYVTNEKSNEIVIIKEIGVGTGLKIVASNNKRRIKINWHIDDNFLVKNIPIIMGRIMIGLLRMLNNTTVIFDVSIA